MSKIKFSVLILFIMTGLFAKRPCPPKTCGYNAPFKVKTCYDLYFEIDVLYWEGLEENLSIGSTGTETIYPNFEFDPGFRAIAGTFFSFDNWSLQGEYTRFHQDTKKTKASSSITPYWAATTELFDDTLAKWYLKFDEAAISLGRDAYFGSCTTSKFHLGLNALLLQQDYLVRYMSPSTILKSNNDLSMWGIGPRIGWDTKWLFCRGFQIFSGIRGSLIYASYYENSHKVYTNDTLTESIEFEDQSLVRPILDLSLGFGWGCYYKKAYINLKAGYSAKVLWNQNLFFKNTSSLYQCNGDLYLHGLTLYFAFYF